MRTLFVAGYLPSISSTRPHAELVGGPLKGWELECLPDMTAITVCLNPYMKEDGTECLPFYGEPDEVEARVFPMPPLVGVYRWSEPGRMAWHAEP